MGEAEAVLKRIYLTYVFYSIVEDGVSHSKPLSSKATYFAWNVLWIWTSVSQTRTSRLRQTLLDKIWTKLFKEFVQGLNKISKCHGLNKVLSEHYIAWVLKNITIRGIWPLKKIAKAHSGSGNKENILLPNKGSMTLRHWPCMEYSNYVDSLFLGAECAKYINECAKFRHIKYIKSTHPLLPVPLLMTGGSRQAELLNVLGESMQRECWENVW